LFRYSLRNNPNWNISGTWNNCNISSMPHSPHPQKGKGGTKEEDRKEEVKEDGLEEKRKGVKGTRRNGIRRQGTGRNR